VICEWKFVGEGRGRAGDGKDGVGCSVASGDMDSGHSAEGAGESSGRPQASVEAWLERSISGDVEEVDPKGVERPGYRMNEYR
jgi:hypothetical protein